MYHDAKFYLWDDLFLFKAGPKGIIISCVDEKKAKSITPHYRSSDYVGHHNREKKKYENSIKWFLESDSIQRKCRVYENL